MLAIVLARKNWREFDQMVALYTRDQGKVDSLAKGIKKITSKNSANLQILSLVDIEIAGGKEVDHLTKVQPIKIFKNIYSDPDKLFLGSFVVKLVDANVLTQERDEKVFNLLLSFLEFLDSAALINSLNLATGFVFKFWHCLGFGSEETAILVWLESEWKIINELKQIDQPQPRMYEFAKNFALRHGGKLTADWPALSTKA